MTGHLIDAFFAIAAWLLSVKKLAQLGRIAVRYEMDNGHKRYFRA
jgi:hypothetical protein